ncbi:hypothetical protein CHS0354_035254 [Potamilus streckersoni]|uniref:Anthranilate phosphoribosyltransferase n=1 Tax=Potamilus streckersoni TaxID=2493646 RepID=A0AAE0VMY0_9BIVA|nr:hypothetical protein CHS0354_035254 [Potamilus streckersoni]
MSDKQQQFQQIFEKVLSGQHIEEAEAMLTAEMIFEGELSHIQTAGILTALRVKTETALEIKAFAKMMRQKCSRVDTGGEDVADIVGTGGDRSGTINVSTTSALVVAAAGVKVAKHGNRSVSSLSGSADLLENWGSISDCHRSPRVLCLQQAGITFMFAPLFHPLIKNVLPVRRELKIRTLFNFLGPLTIPPPPLSCCWAACTARAGVKSAYARRYRSFPHPGRENHAHDFNPETCGFKKHDKSVFLAKNADESAETARRILSGKLRSPLTDLIILNAGFALSAAHLSSPEEGFALAERTILSGAAADKLDRAPSEAMRNEGGCLKNGRRISKKADCITYYKWIECENPRLKNNISRCGDSDFRIFFCAISGNCLGNIPPTAQACRFSENSVCRRGLAEAGLIQ